MTQTRTLSTRGARRAPISARIVLGLLERIEYGSIGLHLPDGSEWMAGHGSPTARLAVHDWSVFDAVLERGDIGLAASFIDGRCTTPSPTDLLDVLVGNRRVLDRAVYGRWIGRLGHRLRHLLNRNSRRGSRRNIQAHYDLGNAFYREWLDESMTYSSAIFDGEASARQAPSDDAALAGAQLRKYRRVLDRARVSPGGRILEIGSGWGGFAEVAASAGVRVRGLTLSTEQLDWARARLARHAEPGLASFALQDYRDERDPEGYDAVVSIEMFEAVGEAWWDTWFDSVHRNLKPDARAVVQTIVIDDALFERYREGTDFIQQYIFPGGMLPSPSRFVDLAAAHGFEIEDATAFGAHYARTLACWHRRFERREAEIRAQGFDEAFVRTWKFYLAYCEAAFRHRSTDVVQFTLRKRASAPR
ncbi:MAG: class I SAM-dependent methyltransferase [Lautropia sp.]